MFTNTSKIFFLSMVIFGVIAQEQWHIEPCQRMPRDPRVTIITSVYNSDLYIKGFLEDIVGQTIFDECELLMIDAASPGNEESIIRSYMEQYPNITYIKLESDPGLYGVWNIGIQLARSEYVTNANTDDRLASNCYELHAQALDENKNIDLVYSDFYLTKIVNETMLDHTAYSRSDFPEFKAGYMNVCLPNNHPMWRVSMHEEYGLFDASYISAGDWEMWCRAVEAGARFKKVAGVLALFYRNPKGLSTNRAKRQLIHKEQKKVTKRYKHMFCRGYTWSRCLKPI